MRFSFAGLPRLAGIATAAVTLASMAWVATDWAGVRPVIKREFEVLQAQLTQDEQTLLLLRFQILMQRRQWTVLSFAEQQELCQIAAALQYVGVPGC